MLDIMTVIVIFSGAGFGLGLCGVGLIGIVNWLDQRDHRSEGFRSGEGSVP